MRKIHLDTDEQGDKEDGDWEEKKEHEEPGTPVQPVAQTHHFHVFLGEKTLQRYSGIPQNNTIKYG